jgi:hypothetical protein
LRPTGYQDGDWAVRCTPTVMSVPLGTPPGTALWFDSPFEYHQYPVYHPRRETKCWVGNLGRRYSEVGLEGSSPGCPPHVLDEVLD